MARRNRAPTWTPSLLDLAENAADAAVPSLPRKAPAEPARPAPAPEPEPPPPTGPDAVGLNATSLPPYVLMKLREHGMRTVADVLALAARRGLSIAAAVRAECAEAAWLPRAPEQIQAAVEAAAKKGEPP